MTSLSVVFARNTCLLLMWRHFMLYIHFNVVREKNSHEINNHVLTLLFFAKYSYFMIFCYCLRWRVKCSSSAEWAWLYQSQCGWYEINITTLVDKIWIYFNDRTQYFISKHKINRNTDKPFARDIFSLWIIFE